MAKGWLTKQVFDQRVDKADAANAALDAAEKQREAARSTVISTEAEAEQISSIISRSYAPVATRRQGSI